MLALIDVLTRFRLYRLNADEFMYSIVVNKLEIVVLQDNNIYALCIYIYI